MSVTLPEAPPTSNEDEQSLLPKPRFRDIDTERAAQELLGRDFCKANIVYPISFDGELLQVEHPTNDFDALYKIGKHANLHDFERRVEITVIPSSAILPKLGVLWPEEVNNDTRVERIVREIAKRAAALHASDIFVEPEEGEAHIRFDVEGIIKHESTLSMMDYENVMGYLGPTLFGSYDKEIGQDGHMAIDADGRRIFLRGSSFPAETETHGTQTKLTMRVSVPHYRMRTFEQLGLTSAQAARVKVAFSAANAGIIIAAPPGNGKSTTVYATLIVLNPRTKNMYAIEDPVEVHIPGITQTRTNERWTQAKAARSLLRQKPSFVFIGETLDSDSAGVALNMTLAAVPCATSLHADDACDTFFRMMSLGIDKEKIIQGVTTVIAQRLLNPVCQHCCESVDTSEDVAAIFRLFNAEQFIPNKVVKRQITEGKIDDDGKSLECKHCFGQGVTSPRYAVFEVINMNQNIADGLRNNETQYQLAKRIYNSPDHAPMLHQAIQYLVDQKIDVEEFEKVPRPFVSGATWLNKE